MNFYTGIFMLFLTICTICYAQNQCDPTMCDNVCESWGLEGTCDGTDRCDCSLGEPCSALVNTTCDLLCKTVELDGECDDDGNCICKAELEVCLPTECEEQCQEDPRTEECEAAGGFVTPIWCLEYGPIKTCGCLCTLLDTKGQFLNTNSGPKNKLNYFVPGKMKQPKQSPRARLTNNNL